MVRYCAMAVDSGGLILEQAAEAVGAADACPTCNGVGITAEAGWPRCADCGGLGRKAVEGAPPRQEAEVEKITNVDLAYFAANLSRVSESSGGGQKMRLNGRDWISWD